MCMQIVSEAGGFVISHKCMLLEQCFLSSLRKNRCPAEFLPRAKKKKKCWTYCVIQQNSEIVIPPVVYVCDKVIWP